MHALIRNQLQARVYRNMKRCACYVAELIISREVFCNVNEVAFLDEVKTAEFQCSK
jgi:hypothetical protein